MPKFLLAIVFAAPVWGVAWTAAAAPRHYYLAEGATGPFFELDVVIANPGAETTPAELRFLKPDGTVVTIDVVLPAFARHTVRVNDIPELGDTAVSTTVSSPSGAPLVVERLMRWGQGRYGGHAGTATETPSTRWYFAEGDQGFFDTYLLLANPFDESADVTISFLLEGAGPVVHEVSVAPRSRFTIFAGDVAGLRGRSFGMVVDSSSPVVAERAMYFSMRNVQWEDGHASLGATEPSTTWHFAEGVTGAYFDTYLLLSNPATIDADVTIRFLLPSGETVDLPFRVQAQRRLTLNIEQQHPKLAETAVAATIVSSAPIVAERATYWPGIWHGAHASAGATTTANRWGLGALEVGGDLAHDAFVLLANPAAVPIDVWVMAGSTGGLEAQWVTTVGAGSRKTLRLNEYLPDGEYAIFLVGLDGARFFAERALYWSPGGDHWRAGASAAGVPIDEALSSSAQVAAALALLEGIRTADELPPAESVVSIVVQEPAILRQMVLLDADATTGSMFLRVPLRRVTAGPGAPGFTVDIALNGQHLQTVTSSQLGETWWDVLVNFPSGTLMAGVHEVTVSSQDVTPADYFLVYAATQTSEGDSSCVSVDGGLSFDCVDPAPSPTQYAFGYRYGIYLAPYPSTRTVDPRYHFLLDSSRYVFADWYALYPFAKLGPYHLDPSDTARLDDLSSLVRVLRGASDVETLRNLQRFVTAVLLDARELRLAQDGWTVLVRDRAGLCSGNAHAFVALAAVAGFDARIVELVATRPISATEYGHVVAEVWVDGKWVVFDPYTGLSLWTARAEGEFSGWSSEDISRESAGLLTTPISAFHDLVLIPGLAGGPLLGDAIFDGADGPEPDRLLDLFNDQATVVVSGIRVPYFETRRP